LDDELEKAKTLINNVFPNSKISQILLSIHPLPVIGRNLIRSAIHSKSLYS